MSPDEVKRLLEAEFVDSDIMVAGEGKNFDIQVISTVFEGLRTVPRQQKVYAVLQAHIAEGVIHAVKMKTLTPSELAE